MGAQTLVTGLTFPEAPRWFDDRLWFSDFYTHTVRSVREGGEDRRVELTLDGPPSGLGRLPGGDLLVVDMKRRRVLRHGPAGTRVHADLSPFATGEANELVVTAGGIAYAGNFGFDPLGAVAPVPATLVRVDPDGSAVPAADGLMFPNGAVVTGDGATLVVAETYAGRLTAFDIGPGGTLTGRRVWAELPDGSRPDGIALDPGGGVWVACMTPELIRVAEGGAVTGRAGFTGRAYACAVGGQDGRRLFACTSEHAVRDRCLAQRSGRIEVADLPE